MPARRIICWNMDGTLGRFIGRSKPIPTRGIHRVLSKLKDAGFTHALATHSLAEMARDELHESRLETYFDGVFGFRDMMAEDRGTSYLKVASAMGLTSLPDELLVVGNHKTDASSDVDLVFLFHPGAVHYDAGVFIALITELGSLGSWRAGFDELRSRSEGAFMSGDFSGRPLDVAGIGVAVGGLEVHGRLAERVMLVTRVPDKYKI